MRCFYHHDTDAVGACKNCGRGLCPACAADVGNGLACTGRCEGEVRALNRTIERNKRAHEKTSGAYARVAFMYTLVAVALLVAGAADWRGLQWMLFPAAVVFGASAVLHYATSRKYRD